MNFGSYNTAMSYQNGVIYGVISTLNINGTLVMTVKDDAFVFQSRRGSSATMLTTKINVNSGGILAINGTNTSASANYGGVVQAAGNLVRGEFNIADDASFYLKSADGGQTFHVPTRVDKTSGGIVFNVNSPKYMLIANNKTQSTTGTAGSDWTGYTTGYLQVNVHHSDVSFYRSGNDYNSGTHQSYNVPNNHTSWDRVGIASMTQYADSGSTGDNYYSLKETPTTNVTGSKANLSDNAYYRVFEIQSYVFNWLKWVPMSEADTPAKLALIEDAENQEEAISDSDHYIRGQYGVSEKLLPVFTEPNADCDGIAEFQNSGGSDKTVTWNTGTGIGATTQTATTDSNGIFVFESNRSQNFSIPNGNPENHVKYQKGGSTISLTIEGETYTTQVATTPTYAPQVYDLQAVNVVNSVIKFKTSMAADEILINGENSAEQYVALQTLTKAGNSKDGAGKEWTFDMGSYNQNHPSDPISAGDGIEFWVKGNDQGIVAESTRLTYQYHDYLAESVGYRLIAADNALPTLVDTVEKMTFGKLQRGKDGLFNRSPLDLSLDYGHLTVGDATVYKKTPWSIQASLIEQGSFGEDELRIEFVNSLQEHAYLTNSGDAVNVMSAPNGNNGDETVEVDSNWNKTDNGEGWYLSLNSLKKYPAADYHYDGVMAPIMQWTLTSVPDNN